MVRGGLWEGPGELEFVLDWVLSGRGAILWLVILINLIYREGRADGD